MPELDHITIKGFKSIASIEKLPLGPVNVLIGANGSGKSNFVGVFALLHTLREGRLQDYVARSGGADKLLHFGEKTTPRMSFEVSFQNEVNQYHVELQSTVGDQLYPANEWGGYWPDKEQYSHPYTTTFPSRLPEAGISDPGCQGVAAYVREHLSRWRVYHFHDTSSSSPMKKTADLNDNRFLRADGSNIAAFLYYLGVKHPESYSLIRRAVQRVAPFLDDFNLAPRNLNPDKIQLTWRHKNSDQYFDASALSDGTLRFIAIATLFLQPEQYRPSVILVDEPELGLHPMAITLLASLIRAAAAQTQVIVSTQSPLLLDHFEPEEVLVADRVDGGTQIIRLHRPELDEWLEEFSLGQLWEKNELGGRPTRA